MSVIRIDSNLTPEHDAALTDYLRGAGRLTREQWHRLREAIDLIEFSCHDITNRSERLSVFDLTVLGMRGDLKYSTWFLTVEDARIEGLDFFITRLYDAINARWLLVVLLTPAAWAVIDGETRPASLEDAASALPDPVSINVGAATLVLILYDDWKARVRLCQTPKGGSTNG